MEEPQYLRRRAEDIDCGLLLDVNNVFASCFNAGTGPVAYIEAYPCGRVVQMHLAGHQHRGTCIIDTHDRPVRPEVWELFRLAWALHWGRVSVARIGGSAPEFPAHRIRELVAGIRRRFISDQGDATSDASLMKSSLASSDRAVHYIRPPESAAVGAC